MPELRDFLVQKDKALCEHGLEPVLAPDRTALVLARQVSSEPDSAFNLKWVTGEAVRQAKFIHLEESAGFGVFVFSDRSTLVALDSGHIYAVANASDPNAEKIIAWLAGYGIVQRSA